MRDGDVFEGDVEFGSAFEQVGAYAGGDCFSLRDQFGGVELGNDGFEDFIANGGEDALVVVKTEGLGNGDVLALVRWVKLWGFRNKGGTKKNKNKTKPKPKKRELQ